MYTTGRREVVAHGRQPGLDFQMRCILTPRLVADFGELMKTIIAVLLNYGIKFVASSLRGLGG
jgi:hypothetical protein